MIYAHIFQFEKDARYGLYEFVEPRIDEVEYIDGSIFYVRMVKLKNGTEHHFMSNIAYQKWCMGRTYEMDGELYHSGYACKERSGEDGRKTGITE